MSQNTNSIVQPIELVGNILETLRFRSSIFFNSDLAKPWGMSLSKSNSIRFHVALKGDFFLGEGQQTTAKVKQHEIVVLTNENEHWVADLPGRKLVESEVAGQLCQLGTPLFQQGEKTHRILCGVVSFNHHVQHPFLNSLPRMMHFKSIALDSELWKVIDIINGLMDKSFQQQNCILDRLAEVLFLLLIERYVMDSDQNTGFISSVKDHRIQQALLLIHRQPNRNWTNESLSKEIGLSKSSLIRYFKKQIGMSPIEYLTHWRLTMAMNQIQHSNESLENIAEMVGFSSAQSLSKAFKRHFGKTTSQYRNNLG